MYSSESTVYMKSLGLKVCEIEGIESAIAKAANRNPTVSFKQ
jgi:NACalpha-BTF3-like transcription factor